MKADITYALYEFGSHQNRAWQLPKSGLAATKIMFGSRHTGVWQLPDSGFTATERPIIQKTIYIYIYICI